MGRFFESADLPEALRDLTHEQLEALAADVRAYLIEQVSRTGGHLGSNLGMVELTIALHAVFRSPHDRLLFDVGHQAYVHKMLTGRAEQFHGLRQLGGISGFPKRAESEHDPFDTGHSSTSISAALGFAIAARQAGEEDRAVVCVIGDGALTGGMAFEALNHLGASGERVLVVLNDNQMSISRNVGGMVGALRTSRNYGKIKQGTRSLLSRIPVVGDWMIRTIRRFKDGVKAAVIRTGVLFEAMGLTYIGPIDGHDIRRLCEHLEYAKKVEGPVILHVHTVKGKGYAFAEEAPELYHGVGRFDPAVALTPTVAKDYSAVFGAKLAELARADERVHAISAAMISGTGLAGFAEEFPARTHDVAIAEQHAVTMAAAMALAGLRPYVAIYSTFLQRAFDQIIHDVSLQKAEVVFCIDRAGLVGNDGETHHGYFDIGYLSMIPNMTIWSATDRDDLEEMLDASVSHRGGPLAIRYPRGLALSGAELGLTGKPSGFAPYFAAGAASAASVESAVSGESADSARRAPGAVVIASGKMTGVAVAMSESHFGGKLPVIALRQLAPLDEQTLRALVTDAAADAVVVVDDHMEKGGLADIVRRALPGRRIHAIGYQDFVSHGDTADLFRACRMDAAGLAERITELMRGAEEHHES